MTFDNEKYEEVGFIKYSGEDLVDGIIDAGSAGEALTGLDEAIRFFNNQQSPDFSSFKYDIPIQTRKGSWEAIVLTSLATIGGTFALSYAKKAGEKLAENDFKDIGLKNIFIKSMDAMQILAKLIIHTKKPRAWDLFRIEPTISDNNAIILNESGEELRIPIEYYQWYQQVPPHLLTKLVSAVRSNRTLTIGAYRERTAHTITITEAEKHYFEETVLDEDSEEIIFPELENGKFASLEGRLIRGSEKTNSIGLEYRGHVINCIPSSGSIRQYKSALFLQCTVEGCITRHSKNRFVADKRPTLIVERVIPLEKDGQGNLFNG